MSVQELLLLVLGVLATVWTVPTAAQDITKVHLLFMNHLDVGFTDYAVDVINLYFHRYFPRAIRNAQHFREIGGPEQFRYTSKAWLISLYLDCPSDIEDLVCPTEDEVEAMEDAILKGDITWHAFPFNTEAEVMDPSLARFAVQMVHSLDDRFGQRRKTVFSQRDVPGTTQALLPILVSEGIRGMSFGVNGATAPPAVPNTFYWQHTSAATNETSKVFVTYHPGGYGGITVEDCPIIPGFSETLATHFRTDNAGPPSVAEILSIYRQLYREFPNATIVASTFDDYMDALYLANPDLPVVTEEIGSTWIHGFGSDPWRAASFNEIVRMRTQCMESGECNLTDWRFFDFSRRLLKAAEHTGGGDIKHFLEVYNPISDGEYYMWSNEEFHANRNNEPFRNFEATWIEQRQWTIDYPLQALEDHPLASRIRESLDHLHSVSPPSLEDFVEIDAHSRHAAGDFVVAFDDAGAIEELTYRGDVLASPTRRLAFVEYQTFTEDDYESFLSSYMYCNYHVNCRWALYDFGKVDLNSANPERLDFHTTLVALYKKENASNVQFCAQMTFADPQAATKYGAPEEFWLEVTIPTETTTAATIQLALKWFNKTPTRIPETFYLAFNPEPVDDHETEMRLSKLGQARSPSGTESVTNGSYIHCVDFTETAKVRVRSLDSRMASFGTPEIFPLHFPELDDGFSFVLSNNIWGTNFVMWYPFLEEDANAAFRFELEVISNP